MNYHNFEDDIHALVLELGRDYFKKGAVHDLVQTDGGWRARVEGSVSYDVTLNGTEAVDAWICNCPYDHGPVCKHVAATLYAVRDNVLSEFGYQLDALSEDQVRELVKDRVLGSRGFAEWIREYLAEI
jgi:uncharacterized Zn finger protein